jgi:hypothetical protein
MTSLIYSVKEVNRLIHTRSSLLTRDPMLALGDWLLRAHKPLGFPPHVRVSTGDLSIEVMANKMPIGGSNFQIEAFFVYKKEEVRAFTLETRPSTQHDGEGFSSKSAGIYQSKEYWDTIKRMRDRLIEFSSNQCDAAYLVALFASRDALHPFWRPILPGRSRGLSM